MRSCRNISVANALADAQNSLTDFLTRTLQEAACRIRSTCVCRVFCLKLTPGNVDHQTRLWNVLVFPATMAATSELKTLPGHWRSHD